MIHMRPLPPPHRPGTRLNLIPKAQGDVAFSDSNAPRITLDMDTGTDRTGQDRTRLDPPGDNQRVRRGAPPLADLIAPRSANAFPIVAPGTFPA
jgi:hypothetical protein